MYKIVKDNITGDFRRDRRYVHEILLLFFIPMKLICDWNGSKILLKDGDKDFMISEYYFLGIKIFQIQSETIVHINK